MSVPPSSGEDSAVRTIVEALLARVLGLRDLDGFQIHFPYALTGREWMFGYDGVGGGGHIMVL